MSAPDLRLGPDFTRRMAGVEMSVARALGGVS